MKLVWLDLEGTLLNVDETAFRNAFLQEIEDFWREKRGLNGAGELTRRCIEETVNNTDPALTNKTVFRRAFSFAAGLDAKDYETMWDCFLSERLPGLSAMAENDGKAAEICGMLKEKGRQLVLIGDPVLPEQAVLEMMRWAGLQEEDFLFIVHSECMHYCKPRLRFYREILEKCDAYPEDCSMVGNDAQADMVPRRLGVPAYFVTDNCVMGDMAEADCDWKGTREDLLRWIRMMP